MSLKLGKALADADSVAEFHWPETPELSGFTDVRSYVVVLAALDGVAAAERSTLLALIVAVMTDLLLLLIAVSGSRTATPQSAGSSAQWLSLDPVWEKDIEQYAIFASANDTAKELALWEGLHRKILWSERPARILNAELTEREHRVVRLLERAGLVRETRSGWFVRRRAIAPLKALVTQRSSRLDALGESKFALAQE